MQDEKFHNDVNHIGVRTPAPPNISKQINHGLITRVFSKPLKQLIYMWIHLSYFLLVIIFLSVTINQSCSEKRAF